MPKLRVAENQRNTFTFGFIAVAVLLVVAVMLAMIFSVRDVITPFAIIAGFLLLAAVVVASKMLPTNKAPTEYYLGGASTGNFSHRPADEPEPSLGRELARTEPDGPAAGVTVQNEVIDWTRRSLWSLMPPAVVVVLVGAFATLVALHADTSPLAGIFLIVASIAVLVSPYSLVTLHRIRRTRTWWKQRRIAVLASLIAAVCALGAAAVIWDLSWLLPLLSSFGEMLWSFTQFVFQSQLSVMIVFVVIALGKLLLAVGERHKNTIELLKANNDRGYNLRINLGLLRHRAVVLDTSKLLNIDPDFPVPFLSKYWPWCTLSLNDPNPKVDDFEVIPWFPTSFLKKMGIGQG